MTNRGAALYRILTKSRLASIFPLFAREYFFQEALKTDMSGFEV